MEREFLKQALQQAEIRRGFCAPNPSVGAVLVKDGTVISRGYHWGCGHAHAEVSAIEMAKGEVSGSTLYVTLEPCCIQGRTPPCTSLILKKQIGRVVFGYEDPNPRVSGQGALLLRNAGVPCEHWPLPEIDEFYRSYSYWVTTGKPWVTAKLAMTLDGKSAGEGGARLPITGEDFRLFVHEKRKRSDAILTSVRTVLADDPRLNARCTDGEFRKQVYVLDRKLDFPARAGLWQTAGALAFFCEKEAHPSRREELRARGAEVIEVPTEQALLSWPAILAEIGRRGAHDLWIEAGPRVFRSLLSKHFVNRAYLGIGLGLAGSKALSALEEDMERSLKSAKFTNWQGIGNDGLCELGW